MGFKLRPYQEKSLKVIQATNPGERSLVVLPTGAGKAILIAALSSQIDGRLLCVVPSKELREQNVEKILMADTLIDVGSVQARIDEVDCKVVVASRQSLTHPKSDRIKRMLEHGEFEYVIIDEVHQAIDQVVKIVKRMNNDAKIIGLTATPYNKDMKRVFKRIDFQKGLLEMIDDGYLCEPQAIMVKSSTDLRHVQVVAGEFNQKQLEDAVNNIERNQLVVKAYFKYAKDRKSTLVFATGIEHSKSLAKEFQLNGIDARYIDSTTNKDEREQLIAEFKEFKFPVLVNVGVLTTGFDHQPTDCIMLARPTKSRILYEQIIGRGLRLADGKENCLIIDINDVVKSHDLMSLSTIFNLRDIKNGETPRQAIKRIKKEDIEEEERKRQEELLRQEMERKKQEDIKLQAQKIRLFNKDMKKRFDECYYDWFKSDNLTYVLTFALDQHYVIEQQEIDDTVMNYCFKVCTEKGNKSIELIHKHNELNKLIHYVETTLIHKDNGFTGKNADWKFKAATDNQLKYVSWAENRWDVHCYFTSNQVKSLVKQFHK